jgi:hypothetical protein
MKLSDYLGQTLIMLIPFIETEHYQQVKLVSVESGGIWIECQSLIDQIYTALDAAASERTPVFFIPYQHILFATVPREGMALNESAFGVVSRDSWKR